MLRGPVNAEEDTRERLSPFLQEPTCRVTAAVESESKPERRPARSAFYFHETYKLREN